MERNVSFSQSKFLRGDWVYVIDANNIFLLGRRKGDHRRGNKFKSMHYGRKDDQRSSNSGIDTSKSSSIKYSKQKDSYNRKRAETTSMSFWKKSM